MGKRATKADQENPVWSEDDFRQARPAFEVLPLDLVSMLPRKRGPQREPAKKLVSLRLDPDVVASFRATGDGWQTRINDVLKRKCALALELLLWRNAD